MFCLCRCVVFFKLILILVGGDGHFVKSEPFFAEVFERRSNVIDNIVNA